LRDYVFGSGRVRVRVEDLVKAGVALGLIQEVDELGCCHVLLRPNNVIEDFLDLAALREILVKIEKVLELELFGTYRVVLSVG
jgi:hypothetical protein